MNGDAMHNGNSRNTALSHPTRQTPLTCTGHTRPIVDLDFSGAASDGYFLLSACKDGKPMLRQGNTGDWVGTFLNHKGAVWSVSINKQATRCCTGSADFTARIWDCVSGEELAQFPHEHIVRSVTFSDNNGAQVATGCQDKLVRIFDLNTASTQNFEPTLSLHGHTATIKKIIWENEQSIITASDDKTLKKWDLRMDCTQRCVHTRTFESAVSDLSLTGGTTITAVAKNNVFFFEGDITQMPSKQYQLPSNLNTAHLHFNKKFFVAGGDDLKIYKYDFETGEELEAWKGHFGPVHIVRFSPDGQLYASGSEDGTIRLWQTTPGEAYGLWKGKSK